jgi:hypothetical protein
VQSVRHVEEILAPLADDVARFAVERDDGVVIDGSEPLLSVVVGLVKGVRVPDPVEAMKHDDILVDIERDRRDCSELLRWRGPVVDVRVVCYQNEKWLLLLPALSISDEMRAKKMSPCFNSFGVL